MSEYVLVTGGTGGLGAAVCRALAGSGHSPLVGYRHQREAAEQVAGETGGIAVPLDMLINSQIDAASQLVGNLGSPLAGVVLCASPSPRPCKFSDISPEELEEHLRANVIGNQRLLAGLIRNAFKSVKHGVVVGILTMAMNGSDGRAMRGMGAYLIGKHGLGGVLAALAADYPWLTVNVLAPGFMETPMLNAFEPRFIELMRGADPRGRFDTPEEVARRVVDCFRKPST